MSVTEVLNTGNQAHFDYDVSKIFVFGNKYDGATLLNGSGGIKSFLPGTLLGRISASLKLVPLASGATDGSEKPVGILLTSVNDLGIAGEQVVDYCIFGEVVQEKVILDGADTLDTLIGGVTIGDLVQSSTMGIKLVESDELTGFDNQ